VNSEPEFLDEALGGREILTARIRLIQNVKIFSGKTDTTKTIGTARA
jgi:hypothetical protein